MRNADQNPAIDRYGHLLSQQDRYPARWVDFFWKRDDDLKIRDVEAVFIPRGEGHIPEGVEGQEFWARYAAYNSRWESDVGNSCAGWLDPDGLNPESLFGFMLRAGFASQNELKRALEEFACLEECEWARSMLRGYDEG